MNGGTESLSAAVQDKNTNRGDLLSRIMTQSSMATRAPVVRPSEKGRTSGLHDCMFPRLSQAHTRTISVLVLL